MRDAAGDRLMDLAGNPDTLQQLTDRLRLQQDGEVSPEHIPAEDLATAVLGTLDGRLSAREAILLREITGLARIIEQAKAEIAEVSVDEIRGSHIPSATGELDAIVEHTAIATDSILESCEELDGLMRSLDASQAVVVQAATTRIYEACSFQDITGQRITKVVRALKAIESKVLTLSGSADRFDTAVVRLQLPAQPVQLLNGPMLPQDAMQQADIDKLLADFG